MKPLFTVVQAYTKQLLGTLLISIAGSGLVLAATERELDAHEHGASTMNLLLDGNLLLIEFTSPAYNIVGFEHAPTTAEQHDTVDKATALIQSGDELFQITQAASCQLQNSTSEWSAEAHDNHGEEGEHHEKDDEHDHKEGEHHDKEDDHDHKEGEHHDKEDDHDHKEGEHHDKEDDHDHKDGEHHDKDGEHHGEGGETHSEFLATYEYQCDKPEKLAEIRLLFFEKFDQLESIDVKRVLPTSQDSVELSADNPVMRF